MVLPRQPLYMSGLAFDLSQLPAGWTPNPERVQSSLTDSDSSTEQTVRLMVRHIRDAVSDPRVRDIASRTAGKWGLGSPENRVCWDVFWFCKHAVRFTIDEQAVAALLGELDQVDFLISPSVLMRMNRPAGDCDDFTMLACALLECNGVPWEIVTVATERDDPRRWSHVYLHAVLPDGRRFPLDPTNGVYPGWEVPAYDVHRKQVWDMEGNRVNGAPASARDLRMHAYRPRGRRGMGQDVQISDSPMSSQDALGTFGPDLTNTGGYVNPTQVYLPAGSVPSYSSGSGSSWFTPGVLTNIINSATRLGQQAMLPSGASLLPSGAIISPAGAATGLLTSGSVGGISLTSILLIAALGLGVVMVANKR